MKNLLILLSLLYAGTAAAQVPVPERYAALSFHRNTFELFIYFDDGRDTVIKPTERLTTAEQEITAAIFKGMHYLSDRGYEIVSGDKDYYVFRRRQK